MTETVLQAPVHLSHAAYEVVWERAELGVQPAALAIHYPLRSAENGGALARRAFEELGRARLAEGTTVHPDLLAALRALVRAPHRYWAITMTGPGEARGPLVAVDGVHAVLAVRDSTHLHLYPVAAETAVTTLVRQLPAAPPASGRSITVREEDIGPDGPRMPRTRDDRLMVVANPHRTELDQLNVLMNTPRSFVGYLYAAYRDRNGTDHRCPKPVVVFDIEGQGRWSMSRRAREGSAWVTTAPATAERLAAQLGELARPLARTERKPVS